MIDSNRIEHKGTRNETEKKNAAKYRTHMKTGEESERTCKFLMAIKTST